MKKCKRCKSALKIVGTVKPGTQFEEAIHGGNTADLNYLDGVEYAVFFMFISCIATLPYWGTHLFLSVVIISLCSAFGFYLWQKPKPLYKCVSCGQMFYGEIFLKYYDKGI